MRVGVTCDGRGRAWGRRRVLVLLVLVRDGDGAEVVEIDGPTFLGVIQESVFLQQDGVLNGVRNYNEKMKASLCHTEQHSSVGKLTCKSNPHSNSKSFPRSLARACSTCARTLFDARWSHEQI